MTVTILTEQVDLTEAKIDREARVLRNVKLIAAGTSLNRRHYSEDVLRKSAPLFEGVPSFDGHETRRNRVAETTGWYANVEYRNGALYADRYFSGTQAGRDVMSVVEDIVSGVAPKRLAGLSINASGKGKQQRLDDGDALVVESITKAESVDDVFSPAAGGSYTEAKQGDALALALIEAMEYQEFLEARPDYTERLRKEFKTARQDEALKAVAAEADQRVKDAEQMTEQTIAALTEAQETAQRLTAERDAALAEVQAARRDLAIEKALAGVRLPQDWRDSLREQLASADEAAWGSIIERETRKAQVIGYRPRVENVRGSDQHIEDAPLDEGQAFNPLPRNGERIEDWAQRITGH